MNITWHGQSCFKIEEKIKGQLVTVVTDPYENEATGLRLPKMKAEIVTVSHDHDDHNNYGSILPVDSEQPKLIDRPGEYEANGVFVAGIGAYHDKKSGEELGKSVMYKMDIGGIKLLHLGDLGTTLSDAQLEKIDDVDVLFVPVGGKYTIDAKEAAEVVRQVEPRIVIPMHYSIPGLKYDIESVDKFKKEMGNNAEEVSKLKISKKDLPQEEIKLVILEKS
jgi:L-ascorbate metabolism protein UlaG (beta-lactamase superfamily)